MTTIYLNVEVNCTKPLSLSFQLVFPEATIKNSGYVGITTFGMMTLNRMTFIEMTFIKTQIE